MIPVIRNALDITFTKRRRTGRLAGKLPEKSGLPGEGSGTVVNVS
jgi:hypothetical protein